MPRQGLDAAGQQIVSSGYLDCMRARFNNGAWALLIFVLIELLSSYLSRELTVTRVTADAAFFAFKDRAALYNLWVAIIFLCLLITAILWTLNRPRWLRRAIFFVNGIFTLQLFLAAILLVVRLMQRVPLPVSTLILDAVIIFITNILIFALWYWFIETGNTRFLKEEKGPAWDLLFPQRQADYPGYTDWQPQFFDYVFVAYNTSVAFSPTDTLPLSRVAKLLMMTQSAISLIAIVVVAGTAINSLSG